MISITKKSKLLLIGSAGVVSTACLVPLVACSSTKTLTPEEKSAKVIVDAFQAEKFWASKLLDSYDRFASQFADGEIQASALGIKPQHDKVWKKLTADQKKNVTTKFEKVSHDNFKGEIKVKITVTKTTETITKDKDGKKIKSVKTGSHAGTIIVSGFKEVTKENIQEFKKINESIKKIQPNTIKHSNSLGFTSDQTVKELLDAIKLWLQGNEPKLIKQQTDEIKILLKATTRLTPSKNFEIELLIHGEIIKLNIGEVEEGTFIRADKLFDEVQAVWNAKIDETSEAVALKDSFNSKNTLQDVLDAIKSQLSHEKPLVTIILSENQDIKTTLVTSDQKIKLQINSLVKTAKNLSFIIKVGTVKTL